MEPRRGIPASQLQRCGDKVSEAEMHLRGHDGLVKMTAGHQALMGDQKRWEKVFSVPEE